jgi:hypothetical protein
MGTVSDRQTKVDEAADHFEQFSSIIRVQDNLHYEELNLLVKCVITMTVESSLFPYLCHAGSPRYSKYWR